MDVLGEACEVVAERKVNKIIMVTISISAEAYRAITGPPDPSERDARVAIR